ncbi:MAG: hypothetical protein O2955_07165 [Planctomycetota bacterium]|nr:hypothetical protein [Planctomycetota bacterium]
MNISKGRIGSVILGVLFAGMMADIGSAEINLVPFAKKPPSSELEGLPLVYQDDFESNEASRWITTDESVWRLDHQEGNGLLSLFNKKSDFNPEFRSPFNRALVRDINVGDFILDVQLQSTIADYGHRDLCLFFGYQDDSHLYYVHFGKQADDHANQIFIVNDAPRKKISLTSTDGTNWDDAWHHARVVRNVESGKISVYFDDMENPVMTAVDKTFTSGLVGVGSFDDTGNFDNVLVYANQVSTEPVVLAGTKKLTIDQPLDEVMVAGIDEFALREIKDSPNRREAMWKRDFSSPEAYAESVAPNRERFRTYIGAVDPREENIDIEIVSSLKHDGTIAEGEAFTAKNIRWKTLDGITGEGLLLEPKGEIVADVIALPDADWTPEMFADLIFEGSGGVALRIPQRLAENGCRVIVPTLISRSDEFSGSPYVRYTNQTHREFVYRMAFEMGRHVIGYEVQKVLAAVDALERLHKVKEQDLPIGVIGVGEGGLLALYSGALDSRIDSVGVLGYFRQREGVWAEPIYRNVWGLLTEFGDAEIAGLIAPRALSIEACAVPEHDGPPAVREGRSGGAAPGKIETATTASVRVEFDRAKPIYEQLGAGDTIKFVSSGEGDGPHATDPTMTNFLAGLGINALKPRPEKIDIGSHGQPVDATERQRRQVAEMVEFTQDLLRVSAKVRDKLWANASRTSVEDWVSTAEAYRDLVYDEMIGRLPASDMPANPRTRKVFETDDYTGYEVVLDVYPSVIAQGILVLPKGMKPGEKRPVVVCQHGLEGTPMSTISDDQNGDWRYYKSFTIELAKRGFITYAPQNPYRGKDRFRTLQRKSNVMKRSLFSYIIPQHEKTLEFLATLPNVDAKRIGFYGLSYGGKTAVRVPPMVKGYALSICSADYNEWVKKNTSSEDGYSYIFTGEYEIFEWNMGHMANYAELSTLMTPRPFMVERGHDDGVAPDEWVAWEFAKVKRHYDKLGIGDKTEIEFFNGPHTINGVKTYEFLHRHLDWPHEATSE